MAGSMKENMVFKSELKGILEIMNPDTTVKLSLAHHTNQKHFKFNKTRRHGNEEWRGHWPTLKPSGFYLADPDSYMTWRLMSKGVHKYSDIELIEFIEKEASAKSWHYVGNVNVEVKRKDILVVTSNDQLPQIDWDLDKAKGFVELMNKQRVELLESGLNEKQTMVALRRIVREQGLQDIWKKIQRKYKAMYVTQEYFDNNDDIFDLHCENFIIFDQNIITDDVFNATLYDITALLTKLGIRFSDNDKLQSIWEQITLLHYGWVVGELDMTEQELNELIETTTKKGLNLL